MGGEKMDGAGLPHERTSPHSLSVLAGDARDIRRHHPVPQPQPLEHRAVAQVPDANVPVLCARGNPLTRGVGGRG